MNVIPPSLFIRLGSHAEKDYLLKLRNFLDGTIVGGNLLEASPGATTSLLVHLAGQDRHYLIDPMTYAFGTYVDADGVFRNDLDWIKSEQLPDRRKGANKDEKVRDFKRSYRSLAERIGHPLDHALERRRAVLPADLSSSDRLDTFCRSVCNYQASRLQSEFDADDMLRNLAAPRPPAALLAPYFYTEPRALHDWLTLNLRLMNASASLKLEIPVHGLLCADVDQLSDPTFLGKVRDGVIASGVSGIWLWFSRFFEDQATPAQLAAFTKLVRALSERMLVFNMHGGFFSLACAKLGLAGISHGIGYGEQKDVIPVIGQSTPTVRYYLPPLGKRLGVPEIERCFPALGINTPADFQEKVCSCVVCKGVVANTLADFSSFGDLHYSTAQSKKQAQTPAAAKRCRFHFLLSRIRERDLVRTASLTDITSALNAALNTWGRQPTLQRFSDHLGHWSTALGA